jgi:hypothetical protein
LLPSVVAGIGLLVSFSLITHEWHAGLALFVVVAAGGLSLFGN